MPAITHDQVYLVACESPLLDRIEESLRQGGHLEQAKVLCKLQQDVGVMFARHEYNNYDPSVGKESAALDKNFAIVTQSRLQVVLEESCNCADNSLQTDMRKLIAATCPSPLLSAPAAQSLLAKPEFT